MRNKIILPVGLILTFMTGISLVHGQNFSLLHQEVYGEGTLEDFVLKTEIGVKNEGEEDSLAWRVTSKNLLATWSITVCEVPGRCYLPGTEYSKFLIEKNQVVNIEVGFYPGEILGEGDIQIEFWHPKFPDKKKTATFKAKAIVTSLLSNSGKSRVFNLFPNPGNENRTLEYIGNEKNAFLLNDKGTTVQIIDLLNINKQPIQLNNTGQQYYFLKIGNTIEKVVVE